MFSSSWQKHILQYVSEILLLFLFNFNEICISLRRSSIPVKRFLFLTLSLQRGLSLICRPIKRESKKEIKSLRANQVRIRSNHNTATCESQTTPALDEFVVMRTKLTMYEAIKDNDDNDHQWREKKDIESALQISRSSSLPPDKERLVSLDVFRGLTVAFMILVDDVGGILPSINHSPWDGVTLADFVMPFFLFIVGVSLAFAYKNLSCRFVATRKALIRSLKLLLLGLFLQGGFIHGLNNLTYGIDVEKIRLMGILQNLKVKCGVRGHTGPGCNAVGMLDRMFLGIQHLYRKPVYARTKQCSINYPNNGPLPPDAPSWCQAPFDPEGLLSSLMATVTCLVGLHYGHIIIHFKVNISFYEEVRLLCSTLSYMSPLCSILELLCFG
ncbi:unnamed protein product [Arabidopsis thaliana]|uniref:Heparan-alpha-glucosaminide N-acetyltransferase catalytic domain-containing protein n=1 Tax=Arabidopsis thaliana TaxID=3702 RepID=Q9FIJ1_ARATH|nr:unnamed protein product [Arabidopsis thaliana]